MGSEVGLAVVRGNKNTTNTKTVTIVFIIQASYPCPFSQERSGQFTIKQTLSPSLLGEGLGRGHFFGAS
jgi:hypothetical protein